ncbi:MAG: O-antigen ligase family protein [Paludibacteraceae bacterium]|nr:O-antigen ligase family protein [Paludibacteraceae bacterium]
MIEAREIISYIFCLVPTIFLIGTKFWKESDIYDKAVAVMLSAFCISNCFDVYERVQVFIAFSLISIIFAIKNHYFKIPVKLYYLFFAYFLWHAISLLWTKDIRMAILEGMNMYVLFLFIPLSFSMIKLRKREKQTILTALFRTISLFAIISFINLILVSIQLNIPLPEWFKITKSYFAGQSPYRWIYNWSNYDSPTYLSVMLVIGLIIGATKATKEFSFDKIHYVEVGLFAILSLLLILASQSRLGLLNFLIICTIFVAIKIYKNKIALSSLIAIIIVGITLLCLFKSDKMQNFFYDPIRVQNFKTAQYYIKQHPILGCGVRGMKEEMDSDEVAQELGFQYAHKDFRNPHYQFLGDWMQTGIIGLALCISIYCYIFIYAIKRKDTIMCLFFINFLTLSFTEMPLNAHWGIMLLLSFIGLFTAYCPDKKRQPQQ